MKPTINIKSSNIGRRKKLSFIITRVDDLSDRGFNIGLEVWQVDFKTGALDCIGSDYAIQSKAWKGETAQAIIINMAYPDLKTKKSGYHLDDSRVVNLQKI